MVIEKLIFEMLAPAVEEIENGTCTHLVVTIADEQNKIVVENNGSAPINEKLNSLFPRTIAHAERLLVKIIRPHQSEFEAEYSRSNPSTADILLRSEKTLTSITYYPWYSEDPYRPVVSRSELSSMLQNLAFMNSTVTTSINDTPNDKSSTFHYPGGLIDFIDFNVRGYQSFHSSTALFQIIAEDESANTPYKLELAFRWVAANVLSCVLPFATNKIPADRGTHLDLVRNAIVRSLKDFASQTSFDLSNFSDDEILTGILCVFTFRLPQPKIENGRLLNKLPDSLFLDLRSRISDWLTANDESVTEILAYIVATTAENRMESEQFGSE